MEEHQLSSELEPRELGLERQQALPFRLEIAPLRRDRWVLAEQGLQTLSNVGATKVECHPQATLEVAGDGLVEGVLDRKRNIVDDALKSVIREQLGLPAA
jgi:hypothetical protein